MTMTNHVTVQLGEKYRDVQTGIEGIAVSRTQYQHGCERIVLEWVATGDIKSDAFDAPRLVRVSDGAPVEFEARRGGDQPVAARPSIPTRLSKRAR